MEPPLHFKHRWTWFLHEAHRRQGVLFPRAQVLTNSKPTIEAVPNMLLEVGDVLEDASVEASVEMQNASHYQ